MRSETYPMEANAPQAFASSRFIEMETQSPENLRNLGIVLEITGKKRGRIFIYAEYLNILSRGMEPL